LTAPEGLWHVPEPLAVREVRMDDGAVIVLRRHGNPAGPRLVLSHGSGLAIDLYYPFWSGLVEEFDLLIYDLRNHGWNPLGPIEHHTVPQIARDQDCVLEAIDHHYGAKPKIGVFHSASALTTLLSPDKGSHFAGLVLFDPPLRRPGITQDEFDRASIRTAGVARRRSTDFRSREAFVELLQFAPHLRHVVPGVPELLAETTLRASADGEGYQLRCPPAYEAKIMEYARIFAVLIELSELRCPVKVLGADPTLPYAYLPTFDLREMATVDYDFLPDATHFLQLEQPAACRAAMRDFLGSLGAT
jgi:pimeloyl-ACP methyl ester carboxylesterase